MQVLVEELRQLQKWVAAQMVEKEGHGVREELAKQPTCQTPEVSSTSSGTRTGRNIQFPI